MVGIYSSYIIVTVILDFLFPDFAIIVTCPSFIPVITPLLFIVATEVSELVQETTDSLPSIVSTLAFNSNVFPTTIE